MPFLIENVKSSCKPNDMYGYAGDEVSIVSDEHENVLIVKNKDGRIFPALAIYVSSDSPGKIEVIKQKIIQTVAAKKTRIPATSKTPSLF